jgi:uncharacterized protein
MKTKFLKIANRRALLVVIALLSVLLSCSEEVFNPALVREFKLQSQTNGAMYTITVGLPSGYDPTTQKYAAIYLLDGEEDFDFVANKCKDISADHSKTNAIVVGIGYGKNRSLDYTPTKISSATGGAPEFMKFIEDQLIPKIEEDFGADTTRIRRAILGHSYGGLFGAFVFTVRNKLFGNYLLLSPSLWFDNEVTLLLEKDRRAVNKDQQQLVFLGIGQLENSGRMQAPFEAFYKILKDNYQNTTVSRNKEKDLDHMGSKNPNIVNALNYFFDKQ